MFLRSTTSKKNGKEHRYWSTVENKQLGARRVVQRPVLYLGEINSSQERAWRKSIEVLDGDRPTQPQTLALFPEDRCEAPDESVVRLRLSQLQLLRPRQWARLLARLEAVAGIAPRPKPCSKRCARAIRRSPIWSARPRGAWRSEEFYVLAHSADRSTKERAMRRR